MFRVLRNRKSNEIYQTCYRVNPAEAKKSSSQIAFEGRKP